MDRTLIEKEQKHPQSTPDKNHPAKPKAGVSPSFSEELQGTYGNQSLCSMYQVQCRDIVASLSNAFTNFKDNCDPENINSNIIINTLELVSTFLFKKNPRLNIAAQILIFIVKTGNDLIQYQNTKEYSKFVNKISTQIVEAAANCDIYRNQYHNLDQLKKEFEVDLYKQYYKTHAHVSIIQNQVEEKISTSIEGIPTQVFKRCSLLGVTDIAKEFELKTITRRITVPGKNL